MSLLARLSAVLLLTVATLAAADVAEPAGLVEAEVNGRKVVFTALSLAYDLEVRGDLLNVSLTQTFANPIDQPVNARYLFPLNRNASVHAMSMRIGDEVIEAVIQEKKQAEQTFKQAQKEGKAASLLTQARPNMFTQKIANLMPGLPITVVIKYSQVVPKVDGAYQVVVPMVVGPRFQPPQVNKSSDDSMPGTSASGLWQLETLPLYPAAAGVDIPDSIVSERVTLNAQVEAPFPLRDIHSTSHALQVQHRSSTQVDLTFAQGKVMDNQDFVLRYALDAPVTQSGILSHWQESEGGYFSLLIEPPKAVAPQNVLRREMVFLLDCSGSMSGLPMQASKRFMREALKTLRPTDTFRIIRFSDSATEFSRQPLLATAANVAQGLRYTASLRGSGGTMMTEGIRQALSAPHESGRVRNVVFLTDGYIGNEVSVLRLVETLVGPARLFTFGVGTGVNRYLMEELGRTGRGFTRYFDPTQTDETMDQVVSDLVARLQSPILTDLSIDWGDLPVENVLPKTLPDLYAGNTLRVVGRFTEPAQGEITVRALGPEGGAQTSAQLRRQIAFESTAQRPVLRQIWARSQIAELNQLFITPEPLRPDQVSADQLQSAITELGLVHNLVTRWTAFVAVSRRIYNEDQQALDSDVALPQVKGVSAKAYATGAVGFAAPEPGLWLSLLVGLALVGAMRVARR